MPPQYSQNNDNALTNLIVNYLPQNMADKELFSMFVTIGPVESCRVMRDPKTGYSYGFGFVNFQKEEDASKAIAQLNGLQIQNKKLKVSYARPSGEDIKDTNLYITNLPRSVTDDDLERIFGKFGKIVQKNILKDKLTGMPRGVAFVRFDKKSEATAAMTEMNGKIPEGGTEALNIKIAEEHGKHKAAYYAGFHAGYSQSKGGPNVGGKGVGRGLGTVPSAAVRPAPFQPVYSVVRSNPAGYGGALRQDKTNYRYNPVAPGPSNPGYSSAPGYY